MKEMSGLRLLKIFLGSEVVTGEEDYKVRISRDFKFPTWDLSYVHWHGYPLNSLPSKFETQKLVELNMPYSNIREFGEGNMVCILSLYVSFYMRLFFVLFVAYLFEQHIF